MTVDDAGGNSAGDDADRLIQRALQSVLEAVPEIPGGEVVPVDTSPKLQPWADNAPPVASGRNKRTLEEVVAEMEARVAANPGARARTPQEPHPADAYLASLNPNPPATGKRSGKRRWHGRGRRRSGRRGGGTKAE